MNETTTTTEDKLHLQIIEALQREADAAELEWNILKDRAAGAKKVWEAKCKSKAEYIRKLHQPLPLLDLWRQANVAELGLPEVIVSILSENGLETIGKIADHTAAGKKLTDVPNIGDKKAECIERALEQYWADHPRPDGEIPS